MTKKALVMRERIPKKNERVHVQNSGYAWKVYNVRSTKGAIMSNESCCSHDFGGTRRQQHELHR